MILATVQPAVIHAVVAVAAAALLLSALALASLTVELYQQRLA